MAKTTIKTRRAGNSAKNAKTARKKTRGKPFAKGNPFAFKPGQSGNPAGRPRDTVTPHLRELVRMRHSEKDGVTYGEMVARSLLIRAINGDVQAIKEVFDRLEGKPRQALDVTVEERKRELFENAVEALVAETKMSRDEAVEQLLQVMPEANQWVN